MSDTNRICQQGSAVSLRCKFSYAIQMTPIQIILADKKNAIVDYHVINYLNKTVSQTHANWHENSGNWISWRFTETLDRRRRSDFETHLIRTELIVVLRYRLRLYSTEVGRKPCPPPNKNTCECMRLNDFFSATALPLIELCVFFILLVLHCLRWVQATSSGILSNTHVCKICRHNSVSTTTKLFKVTFLTIGY